MQRTDNPKSLAPKLESNKPVTADDVIDDSLRSARNTLAMLHGTKEVAADTAKELHAQGEQIKYASGHG